MKITEKQIRELKPCPPGLEWYEKNKEEDLLKLLLTINKFRPEWARWLYTSLMSQRQCVQIAVFAAESVIDIYEAWEGSDNRPRESIIRAARDWLDTEAADAAAAASDAAFYASLAADATDASEAAEAASDAADAAARAATDSKQMEEKLIREAVRILEE